MSSKKIATFRVGKNLLTGHEAVEAWKSQSAKCDCGCGGSADATVNGICKDMPAVWIECKECTGTAIGRPLVFRLKSQMELLISLQTPPAADRPGETKMSKFVINTECGLMREFNATDVESAKEQYEHEFHYDFVSAKIGESPGSWYWIIQDGEQVENYRE